MTVFDQSNNYLSWDAQQSRFTDATVTMLRYSNNSSRTQRVVDQSDSEIFVSTMMNIINNNNNNNRKRILQQRTRTTVPNISVVAVLLAIFLSVVQKVDGICPFDPFASFSNSFNDARYVVRARSLNTTSISNCTVEVGFTSDTNEFANFEIVEAFKSMDGNIMEMGSQFQLLISTDTGFYADSFRAAYSSPDDVLLFLSEYTIFDFRSNVRSSCSSLSDVEESPSMQLYWSDECNFFNGAWTELTTKDTLILRNEEEMKCTLFFLICFVRSMLCIIYGWFFPDAICY